MEFFTQSVVDTKKSTKKQLNCGIEVHKKGCNICLLNDKSALNKL